MTISAGRKRLRLITLLRCAFAGSIFASSLHSALLLKKHNQFPFSQPDESTDYVTKPKQNDAHLSDAPNPASLTSVQAEKNATKAFPEARVTTHVKEMMVDLTKNSSLAAGTKDGFPNKQFTTTSVKEIVSVTKNSSLMARGFPETRFTAHAKEMISHVKYESVDKCPIAFRLEIAEDGSVSKIDCDTLGTKKLKKLGKKPLTRRWWCNALHITFLTELGQTRVLPCNVSFGMDGHDFLGEFSQNKMYGCLGSSSAGGRFVTTNWQEWRRMTHDNITYPIIPWEKRQKVPVFRGTPWFQSSPNVINWKRPSEVYKQVQEISPRLRLLDFSIWNPSLLDARLGKRMNFMETDERWSQNATYGLYNLTLVDNINKDDYYTQYQVTIVSCGIGAAFRFSIFLSTETAVVLQGCPYEEWFTKYMTPFEHYIPLSEDMRDIEEKMLWVSQHPKEVHQIAKNGRAFYLKYLSFKRNQEHLYEFLYRLAQNKSECSPTGSIEQ